MKSIRIDGSCVIPNMGLTCTIGFRFIFGFPVHEPPLDTFLGTQVTKLIYFFDMSVEELEILETKTFGIGHT